MRPIRQTLVLLALLASPVAVHAQKVSPAFAEFGKRARGKITVTNDGLTMLRVEVQPFSFTPTRDKQTPILILENGIHVRVGDSSFVLPAKTSRTVDYEATCEILPCHFVLLHTFRPSFEPTPMPEPGPVYLTTGVYVCEQQKDCRKTIRESATVVVQYASARAARIELRSN